MRIINLVILLFLLTAFAIGSVIQDDDDKRILDAGINNASEQISNISLQNVAIEDTKIPNMKGLYLILEKYIHFIGVAGLEIMRAAIYFGSDNPGYFTPEFVYGLLKLVIILLIIGLLVKPVGYLVIFIVLFGMYINDKIKKRRRKKENATRR